MIENEFGRVPAPMTSSGIRDDLVADLFWLLVKQARDPKLRRELGNAEDEHNLRNILSYMRMPMFASRGRWKYRMTPYVGWTPEPDEVLALSVDELGLRVLADIAFQQSVPGAQQAGLEALNERTWLNDLAMSPAYAGRADAVAACSEAWGWLRSRVLVATDGARGQFGDGWVIITRRGRQILDRGLDYLRAVERLDVDLHPILEEKARPQFLRGDFETAVFVAFKEVEVRVRAMAELPDLIGVALMHEAFGVGKPLAPAGVDRGEVVAEMELYAGALGLFKNPTSHRFVDYGSATEAAEVVLLADLLLRLLDRRAAAGE
jgi:uncharacterized protein (TIGR02391 family)